MKLSPDTLGEESLGERRERERKTGVIGNGLSVYCYPSMQDRDVVQVQHRAACLVRPYEACGICPHASFTLFFDAARDPYQKVACPRWNSGADRLRGENPEAYAMVEEAMCSKRPFEFCASCPGSDEVAVCGADKVRPGWYTRWRRLSKEEEDDE